MVHPKDLVELYQQKSARCKYLLDTIFETATDVSSAHPNQISLKTPGVKVL